MAETDSGETETEAHIRNKKGSAALLAALRKHHHVVEPVVLEPVIPDPVKGAIEIKEEIPAVTAIEVCVLPVPTVNTIESIKRVVCKHFEIRHTDIVSIRRTNNVTRPRQIAMYLCRMHTPRSLPEIAKRFGNRDHTTALHAVRTVAQLMTVDPLIAGHVKDLEAQINA